MVRYPYKGKPSWPHSHVGVHLQPEGYHTWSLREPRRSEHLAVLKKAKVKNVLAINDGDSLLEKIDGKEAVRWYLDNQINVLVRDGTDVLPRYFVNQDNIKRLVAVYNDYGMVPAVQVYNEPGDDREWKNHHVPQNWKDVALDCIKDAIRKVLNAGANFAIPDPLADWAWWFEGLRDFRDEVLAGRVVFFGHFYYVGRPRDYPEDDVSLYGTQLTEEEYQRLLDDFWPAWATETLDQINAARGAQADASRTWRDESICFNAWRHVQAAALDVFGEKMAIAMTEGGPTPKDRAGSSAEDQDIRYVLNTPKQVAVQTANLMRDNPGEFYATCPWLLWGQPGQIGGSAYWYYNPLFGVQYGPEMPVIAALQNLGSDPLAETVAVIDSLQASIGDLRRIFGNT